jgi:hypothetical protein
LSGIAKNAPALADQLTGATNTLSGIANGAPALADQFTDATNTLSGIASGADPLARRYEDAAATLSGIATGADPLARRYEDAAATLSGIATGADPLARRYEDAAATLSGIASGADPLARRYEDAAATLGGIATGADPLARRYEEALRQLEALIERAEKVVNIAESGTPVAVTTTTPATTAPAPVTPPPPPPPPPPIATLVGAFPAAGILNGETALGDALADAIAYYVRYIPFPMWNVDFAFINGGIVKAGLEAGDVTEAKIQTIVGNSSAKLIYGIIRGSDVIKLFGEIAAIQQGTAGFAQVSEDVAYTIDYTSGTGKLSGNLLIHNTPVLEDIYYTFVTTDELYNGNYGYNVKAKTLEIRDPGYLVSDVVLEVVKFFGENGWTLQPYNDPAKPRIKIVK